MDIRLIVLAVVLVVLLVAFGNNPLETSQDTRSGDPFQRALEDRLQQSNTTGGGGYFGTGTAGAMQPAQQQPLDSNPPGALGLPPGSYPGVQQPSWNRAPPPRSSPTPAFFLTDGRRIFFQGYKVFTLESNGNLSPLPDGRYALKDGTPIIIQNGERQSSNTQ